MRNSLIIASLFVSCLIQAQRTSVYTDSELGYMDGRAYFDAAIYGNAIIGFNDILDYNPPVYQPNNKLLTTHAEFAKAQAAVRMELPEAELMVLNFIEKHEPDPVDRGRARDCTLLFRIEEI